MYFVELAIVPQVTEVAEVGLQGPCWEQENSGASWPWRVSEIESGGERLRS